MTFPDLMVAKWFRFRSGDQLRLISDPSEREAPAVSLDDQ